MLRGGLACFMDEMDSKLDTKEKGLAFEMARAMQPAAQRGSLLDGIDLLMQQILELPCTAGGVEFSSSQVRDKLRNKYRDDPKLAEKFKEALQNLSNAGLLKIQTDKGNRKGGRKTTLCRKPALSEVEASKDATDERVRLNVGKSVFP